jgi:hypothetical protein
MGCGCPRTHRRGWGERLLPALSHHHAVALTLSTTSKPVLAVKLPPLDKLSHNQREPWYYGNPYTPASLPLTYSNCPLSTRQFVTTAPEGSGLHGDGRTDADLGRRR